MPGRHPAGRGISVETIGQSLPQWQRVIFRYGQRGDVADAPAIEIAAGRMVFVMVAAPVFVGCQRQQRQTPADPVARGVAAQEGMVAAIVLNDWLN